MKPCLILARVRLCAVNIRRAFRENKRTQSYNASSAIMELNRGAGKWNGTNQEGAGL